jgi:hypothetical protein
LMNSYKLFIDIRLVKLDLIYYIHLIYVESHPNTIYKNCKQVLLTVL